MWGYVVVSPKVRFFWQRPRTHREVLSDRRVTFLELFYDLVYVVLIARIALGLHAEITARTVGAFVILFGLVWIGWYNGSLLHDAHGRADTRNRLLTFLQMFALSAMAVFVTGASTGAAFAVWYTAFLAVLAWQWVGVARLERSDPVYGRVAGRYAVAIVVMTVWVGASAFAGEVVRMWMWGGFVILFVGGAIFSAFTLDRDAGHAVEAARPLATESLLERFALFVIIVLGEVVASGGQRARGGGTPQRRDLRHRIRGAGGGVAFWWCYFDLVAMRAQSPAPRPLSVQPGPDAARAGHHRGRRCHSQHD